MEKNKTTLRALGVVFISFLLSTMVSLYSLQSLASHNVRELGKELTAHIHEALIRSLADPIITARTMSNDQFLIDLMKQEEELSKEECTEALRRYLNNIHVGLDFEQTFMVSEKTHRYYTYEGILKEIDPENDPFDDWYNRFLNSGKVYDMDVDLDEMRQETMTIFVNTRLQDEEGNLLGVCGVGILLKGPQDLFQELEKEYDVKINLVDENGLIQIGVNDKSIETEYVTLQEGLEKDSLYHYQDLGSSNFAITRYVEGADWFLVVRGDASKSQSQYLLVILLNGGLCLLVMIIFAFLSKSVLNREKALTRASFYDEMTLLYNRRAYEQAMEYLLNQPLSKDFVYAILDLNGLKYVNDTKGHAYGDSLIEGAASSLKECFGSFGKIYRIGGDEFVLLLNISRKRMEEQLELLSQKEADWTGKHQMILSLAWGIAYHEEFPEENATYLGRIADERMYQAKNEYYEQQGFDRRRRRR